MVKINIAYFITGHGFGHGTRSAAVIEQLVQLDPLIDLHIYTDLPAFLLRQSISHPFELHVGPVDFGLVQHSAVSVNIDQSIKQLEDRFESLMRDHEKIALELKKNQINAVVSDISPLGILAAQAANIPSFLVSNFTWDWIYQGLAVLDRRFISWADRFGQIYEDCDFRFECTPHCNTVAPDSLLVGPVARQTRVSPAEIRRQLGVQANQKLVFLTLGGWVGHPLVVAPSDDFFVVAAGQTDQEVPGENRLQIPWESRFFHPDLVQAADLLICKLGYSTVAEAYLGGTAVLYLARHDFPESPKLAAFVEGQMLASEVTEEQLTSGHWVQLYRTLSQPHSLETIPVAGARQIADTIIKTLQ